MTPDEIATRTRDAIMHADHSVRRKPLTPVVVMVAEDLRALLDDRDALKARVAELEGAALNLTSKEQTR